MIFSYQQVGMFFSFSGQTVCSQNYISAPLVFSGAGNRGFPSIHLSQDFPAAVQYKRLPTFALWVSPVAFVSLLGTN